MDWRRHRIRMVRDQLRKRDIHSEIVLRAMENVPRHLFVPAEHREHAYDDCPLPLGPGQTISQPYIVAYMSQALALEPGDAVLEIGTGSGYQAAVLAEMGMRVRSLEIDAAMSARAAGNLERAGYPDVRLGTGDGWSGWPEEGPYDAIIVTAAPRSAPRDLAGQLREGGRMIVPVGEIRQELLLIVRRGDALETRTRIGVSFVPMRGRAEAE